MAELAYAEGLNPFTYGFDSRLGHQGGDIEWLTSSIAVAAG